MSLFYPLIAQSFNLLRSVSYFTLVFVLNGFPLSSSSSLRQSIPLVMFVFETHRNKNDNDNNDETKTNRAKPQQYTQRAHYFLYFFFTWSDLSRYHKRHALRLWWRFYLIFFVLFCFNYWIVVWFASLFGLTNLVFLLQLLIHSHLFQFIADYFFMILREELRI